MSTEGQEIASYFPPGVSIFGGLPLRNQDLGPAILFIVLFAALIPLALWRLISPKSRSLLVIRAFIFIPVRIATYCIRAVEASGTYTTGLFIAELILIISGFNLICEPLVAVMEHHIHSSAFNANVQEPYLVQRLLKLMQIALIVSLALGIYVGTLFGSDNFTANTISNIDTYRLVCSAINIAVVGLTIIIAAVMHKALQARTSGTLFVIVVGLILCAPSAYRLAAVENYQPLTTARTKIFFYVFSAAPEWIATVAFLMFNLHNVFDLEYKHPGSGGPIGRIVNTFRGQQTHQNTRHPNPAYAQNQPNYAQNQEAPQSYEYYKA